MAMQGEGRFAIDFLTTTNLGEKGQLTVPKEFREALTLEAGDPIAVVRIGNGLMLIPEHSRIRLLCERITKVFARHDIAPARILATLPEARKRVFARRYPGLARRARKPPRAGRK